METSSDDFEKTNEKKTKSRHLRINVENDTEVINKKDKTLLLKKVQEYSSSINSNNRNIIVKYINFGTILYNLKTLIGEDVKTVWRTNRRIVCRVNVASVLVIVKTFLKMLEDILIILMHILILLLLLVGLVCSFKISNTLHSV